MTKASESYKSSIEVSASPQESFDAVTKQMNLWWTETTEGQLINVGDTVKAIFPPDFGHWSFEATALDRGARIEMLCVDAHHHVEGLSKEIEQEWLGTRVIWEFASVGDKTKITLTHHGLTPQLNCWDICLDGWNYFFKISLKGFLTGDIASPHKAS